jgi:hypothetical protein
VVEQEEVDVAKLDVSGSFLIWATTGVPPETWVVISVLKEDGTPKILNFQDLPAANQPVVVFVSLSAFFSAHVQPLRIVEVHEQNPGFYALRVEYRDRVLPLEGIRPTTLGVIVQDEAERGQALVCSCDVADVTTQVPGHG